MINKIPVADRAALEHGLKRLKLRHTREIVDSVNELAMEEEPGYIDFLAYLVDHEIKMREETQRLKNMKRAKFPQLKTLDEFDYSFQNSINQQSMRDLEGLDFMHAKENVVFLGPSGVGKTHLAIGLGVAAVNAGYKVRFYTFTQLVEDLYASLVDSGFNKRIDTILKNHLIILDELGYVSMDETASDHIFQFIARAYEHRSLIVTSNLNFAEWGTLFASTSTAAATLDRLLHHAHVFNMKGDSYRMRNRLVPTNIDQLDESSELIEQHN